MIHSLRYIYKYSRLLCLVATLISAQTVYAAAPPKGTSGSGQTNESYTKRGWSIAPLPAVSYDSDLGFQLGAIVDAYYFGDGSIYPEYIHKFTAEACYFTKGSGIYHLFYDSKHLLKNLRLTASASYIPNTMMPFYGFNGYASPYLRGQNDAFYAVDRNLFRIMGDLQGAITGNFGWAAGISFFNYNTGRVKAGAYSGETTLYDIYLEQGIIRPDEAHGGSHIELRAGVVYDTRDHEPDPSHGIYADAILYGSPDIINGQGYSYLKIAAAYRQYISLIPKRLTIAYRICYQGTLAGNTPFYVQQNYTTLFLRQINSDILGGAISLRGVQYNRIMADGVAWANLEFRLRLFDFRFLRQKWYISTNPFFDIGMATQPFRLAEMKESGDNRIYSGEKESLHMSVGIGLKFVMNDNFVLSAEFGKPFDKRDGDNGLYLNINYIF